jgi:hypothetical protein
MTLVCAVASPAGQWFGVEHGVSSVVTEFHFSNIVLFAIRPAILAVVSTQRELRTGLSEV